MRSLMLVALVASASAVAVAPALASQSVQPAHEPARLDPTGQPRGGAPEADDLFWQSPNSCDKRRFEGRTGTRRLYEFVEYWWPRAENWGYGSDPCRDSLHDEGRAVDLHLDVRSRPDRRTAHEIKRFFLRDDSDGAQWAMARRFGIQEFIYNCHIWTSTYAERGWRRYSRCTSRASYTLKHKDHIHIGQSWQGARKKTSAYTGYEVCDGCVPPEEPAPPARVFETLPDAEPPPDLSGNPVAASRR
jgi:hypothetical protein